MASKSDQEIAKELSDKAMREQPHGKVGRVKVRKDEDGSFVTEYYKKADSKKPFAEDRDRTRGVDPEFSRKVEEGNKRRAEENYKRIKREMGDADKYAHGGMVRKYGSGGEVKRYPNEGLKALAKEAPEVVARMGYKKGGEVKGYRDGGLAKGQSCPHRGKVRGTGAAIRGAKFTGTK